MANQYIRTEMRDGQCCMDGRSGVRMATWDQDGSTGMGCWLEDGNQGRGYDDWAMVMTMQGRARGMVAWGSREAILAAG